MNRETALIAEALKWYGTTEVGGDNRGLQIEAFQKAVDRTASGEPWCMAFLQYCLKASGGSDLFQSEHCLTVWQKSPIQLRRVKPTQGCIVIWRLSGTSSGHAGIVVLASSEIIVTIEGNTGPGPGIVRDGDGVYMKVRPLSKNVGLMEHVGYLYPWLPASPVPPPLSR